MARQTVGTEGEWEFDCESECSSATSWQSGPDRNIAGHCRFGFDEQSSYAVFLFFFYSLLPQSYHERHGCSWIIAILNFRLCIG